MAAYDVIALALLGGGLVISLAVHWFTRPRVVRCTFCRAPMLRSELRCHHCQGSVSTFVRAKREPSSAKIRLPPRSGTGG